MENRKRNVAIAQLDTRFEDQQKFKWQKQLDGGASLTSREQESTCTRGTSTIKKSGRGKSSVEFIVNWEVLKDSLPVGLWNAQATILQNTGLYDLFVGGGLSKPLYRSTTLKMTQGMPWDLCATPVSFFALTTYNSYPVLVGGLDVQSRQLSNKLWVLDNATGDWVDSKLPPMLTERQFASALNYQGHLIVAGGRDISGAIDTVEMFDGCTWRVAHALPKACYLTKATVHNGYWYLIGGVGQGSEVYCAQLDLLIYTTPISNPSAPVWKKMAKFPLESSSLGVLSDNLIGIGGKVMSSHSTSDHSRFCDTQGKGTNETSLACDAYHTYSFETSTWMYKGDMPLAHYNCCTIELPTGEILVIGGQSSDGNPSRDIIKGKPTRSSDEEFANLWRKNTSLLLGLNELKKQVSDLKEQLSEAKSSSKDINLSSETITSVTENGLCGVEICGETTLNVTNRALSFYWKNYGLRVHISKDSLKKDIQQCSINIKASLAGQYEFPISSRNVSAVYWFRCKPFNTFIKPVAIEIQHCGGKHTDSNLTFVRCHCTQKQLPYAFKALGNGSFSTASSYGYIKLDHFSGIAVTQESDIRQYCACMFYVPSTGIWSSRFEIHFAFTWNTEIHLNVLKKHYKEIEAIPGPDQEVEFEGDAIKLDIPMEGKTVPCQNSSGKWDLIPLKAPVVLKKQLDEYTTGKLIPCCPLRAKIVGTDLTTFDHNALTLTHPIQLVGAKQPYNFFTIDFTPPCTNIIENHTARRKQENNYESAELMKHLESGDLCDIALYLDPLENKQLRRLGVYLGLEYCNLEKMDHLPDKMLAAWLRKEDNVLQRTGPPTKKVLCEILDSKMRQPGIAKNIADSCQVQIHKH